MHVGVARLTLHVAESQSLKTKRQASRSLAARIRNQFNVSVAEEPDNHLWQQFTLVVCCVSGEASHCHQTLSKVVSFVEASRLDLVLEDYQTEVIPGV